MALSVDSTSSATPVTNSSVTWAHTCAASATKLVVAVGIGDTAGTVSTVTYNGDALSFVGAADDTTWSRSELWQLNTPDTGGAFNIVVNTSVAVQLCAGAISFIDAAAALGTPTSANNTTANPSVTVADTASGDIVVSLLTTDNAAGATTQNGTLIFENEDFGSDIDVNFQRQTASGSNTVCSWGNTGTGDGWAAIGVAVKATGGGGASASRMGMLGVG